MLPKCAPTHPPSRQCWRDDGAAAHVQKGNLFSQAASHPRRDTINIDEEGEGVELSLNRNAFGNLFSQTPVLHNIRLEYMILHDAIFYFIILSYRILSYLILRCLSLSDLILYDMLLDVFVYHIYYIILC